MTELMQKMQDITNELEERASLLSWNLEVYGMMVYVSLPREAMVRYDLQWEFAIRPYKIIGDQIRVSFYLVLMSDLGILRRLLDASADELHEKKTDDYGRGNFEPVTAN